METIEITDVVGVSLIPGSIVEMSDSDGPWSEYQGLVMVPDSEIEDDGYSVAVFFDKEVSSSRFWFNPSQRDSALIPIGDWDHDYGRLSIEEKTTLLLKDDFWKKCPRVHFFRPDELNVVTFWKIETLMKRLFGRMFHRYYVIQSDLSPTAFMCWCADCQNRAEKLALYNFWGTVYPYNVCAECFSKINGICGESEPKCKNPILMSDGSGFKKEES